MLWHKRVWVSNKCGIFKSEDICASVNLKNRTVELFIQVCYITRFSFKLFPVTDFTAGFSKSLNDTLKLGQEDNTGLNSTAVHIVFRQSVLSSHSWDLNQMISSQGGVSFLALSTNMSWSLVFYSCTREHNQGLLEEVILIHVSL